jgi:hypothetical protein
MRQHRSVHRASGRAGDCFYLQPRLLEQAIEHTPGKRAMRASALQGKIHLNRLPRGSLQQRCGHHRSPLCFDIYDAQIQDATI